MKRLLSLWTTVSIVLLYGGGKNLTPALEPVAQILPLAKPSAWYVGVGGLWSGMRRACECSGGEVEETTYGAMMRVGYDFNPYVGLEARGLYSSIQKDIASTTHYGLYLKPMYPLTSRVNLYGLLGYAKTKITCLSDTLSYNDNGFSWGVGVEYDLSSKGEYEEALAYKRPFDGIANQERGWGVWLDYQSLLHNATVSHFDSNIVTIGVTYDF